MSGGKSKWNRWNPGLAVVKYAPTSADVPRVQFAKRLNVCSTCRHRVAGECRANGGSILLAAKVRSPAESCERWPESAAAAKPVDLAAVVPAAIPATSSVEIPHSLTSRETRPDLRLPGEQLAAAGVVLPTVCKPYRWNSATLSAAVVVISHNYGRFLRESIESALDQSRPPAEVLVIDDASGDETSAIAREYAGRGVRLIRSELRNVHAVRRLGLANTSAPVLCFLDADNKLPHDYLAAGLAEFTSPTIGVVYPDLRRFGDRVESTAFPAEFDRDRLARENFVDAGALIRRDALELSHAFAHAIDPRIHSDDWHLFRRIAAGRWGFRKSAARLWYRVHGDNCSVRHVRHASAPGYFDTAGLAFADLTLFVPLSGRLEIWNRHLAPYLDRQTWPRSQTRLVLCDTSQNEQFSNAVRDWIRRCDYRDVRYLALAVEDPGLADRDRRRGDVERRVQNACCQIYNRAAAAVETDYAWILEDDILPPLDAAERLLRCFSRDVATVSGAYQSRYDPAWIVWDRSGVRVPRPAAGGVQSIGGTGFGCLMARAEVLKRWTFNVPPGAKWYDPAFFDALDPAWLRLINWGVACDHLSDRVY